MGKSKIIYDNEVLMDLTGDSVRPSVLLEGETAHDSAGEPIAGALKEVRRLSATVGTAWTGTSAPYTQVVSVPGILATDGVIADVELSSDFETGQKQQEAWGMICRITTAAGKITVYSSEKTTTAIQLKLLAYKEV